LSFKSVISVSNFEKLLKWREFLITRGRMHKGSNIEREKSLCKGTPFVEKTHQGDRNIVAPPKKRGGRKVFVGSKFFE